MKTRPALAITLATTLMLALLLVGCGGTAQTHPRTVKDVDLTKYADMKVGNLVVIYPDGKEKKYDVSADFWVEQDEDNVWFYDEYKYALIIEKGVVGNVRNDGGGNAIHLERTGSSESGTAGIIGTRIAIDKQVSSTFGHGDTVIVCGNIDDVPNHYPELDRNTQAIAA